MARQDQRRGVRQARAARQADPGLRRHPRAAARAGRRVGADRRAHSRARPAARVAAGHRGELYPHAAQRAQDIARELLRRTARQSHARVRAACRRPAHRRGARAAGARHRDQLAAGLQSAVARYRRRPQRLARRPRRAARPPRAAQGTARRAAVARAVVLAAARAGRPRARDRARRRDQILARIRGAEARRGRRAQARPRRRPRRGRRGAGGIGACAGRARPLAAHPQPRRQAAQRPRQRPARGPQGPDRRPRPPAARLALPRFPTTTIGSFPQTNAIRACRRDYKQGRIGEHAYRAAMQAEIAHVVAKQEQLGLDVLVHGEAERNDMVEYFGEQLAGFAFSRNGWVQSYGSRCVKPPILYGDVSRPRPMTVEWIAYAQSLTAKPMKGLLNGPVTILNWSFVRADQPRATPCLQLALALRDEVLDLEAAGSRIIQIDEAALRECLPLRQAEWRGYLDWVVRAFRITAARVQDGTQIHTHMCYSEFNDIIEAVAAMDADVITIETSRSDMELLDVFERIHYSNEIGPGVYDIHTPNEPKVDDIVALMKKAAHSIPAERLWINPDCGLKTRGWPEVETALAHMVEAARRLRGEAGRAVG